MTYIHPSHEPRYGCCCIQAAILAHMVDNPVYDPEGTKDETSYSINSGANAKHGEAAGERVHPLDMFRHGSLTFSAFDARVRTSSSVSAIAGLSSTRQNSTSSMCTSIHDHHSGIVARKTCGCGCFFLFFLREIHSVGSICHSTLRSAMVNGSAY